MTEIVAVVVNGELTIRYDRSRALTDRQRESLDGLDRRMEQEGVELEGARIIAPDLGQRSRFIADRIEARATRQGWRVCGFANRLVEAMIAEDEPRVAALVSYLAERLTALKQIKALTVHPCTAPLASILSPKVDIRDEQVMVDLVLDQSYVPQSVVHFADGIEARAARQGRRAGGFKPRDSDNNTRH